MLKSLYIKNYALIDELKIEFENGFSVITGETGAGKSIILGALALILGQRAETKYMKQDIDKCIIEGVFNVSGYNLKALCDEYDVDYDDSSDFIIRREILSSGKSRAFINDTPATLQALKAIGEQLIDIHSQHENLLLSDKTFQLDVVDTMANHKTALEDYQKKYKEYKSVLSQLVKLKAEIAKSKDEEEYLRFQFDSLNQASLKEGEQEELESELSLLNNAEEIKTGLYKIHLLLSNDDTGVITSLKDSLNTALSLSKVYSPASEIASRTEVAYIDLKDMASNLERMADDVEFNSERLAFVQERLDTIYSLQTRYKKVTVEELIYLREELGHKISKLDLSDEEVKQMESKLVVSEKEMLTLAAQLTKNRQGATKVIEKQLIDKIATLGMPNVQLKCQITKKEQVDQTGADDIEFLFSANKNIPLQPIAQVASGGEISRFMLCLKSMLAGAKALLSIIFDEIDTGVSGEISDKMGIIMKEFGDKMQVIAITHQPQIAAKGKVHYKVFKKDDKQGTTTHLIRLTNEQRLAEIAGMLSGATITDAARENAKVMLGL